MKEKFDVLNEWESLLEKLLLERNVIRMVYGIEQFILLLLMIKRKYCYKDEVLIKSSGLINGMLLLVDMF